MPCNERPDRRNEIRMADRGEVIGTLEDLDIEIRHALGRPCDSSDLIVLSEYAQGWHRVVFEF
jgi:hypothetical protein